MPVDEIKEQKEIDRGVRASQIMDEGLVPEAFALMRHNIFNQFEASKAGDAEGREQLWYQLNAVKQVEKHMRTTIETGKMAEKSRQVRRKQEAKKQA
jgi:hypothetical protein